MNRRIVLMDEIRGFCVFCMIFYHAFVFMDVDGFSLGTKLFDFFLPVEPFFAAVFIVICGFSSNLSRSNFKRGFELLGIALAINIITVLILPKLGFIECEIYFGIINLLSVSILIYAVFEKALKKINPVAGTVVCFVILMFLHNWVAGKVGIFPPLEFHWPEAWRDNPYLFPFGIIGHNFFSADYFPLIPYFFIFLMGTFIGAYCKDKEFPEFVYKNRVAMFNWLGRHALLVYVLHMPIIYAFIFIFELILR